MKRTISILCAAIFAATTLTNCASTGADQKAQSAQLANLAITAAEIGGAINPTQAAVLRKSGVLLLDAIGSGKQPDLQVISSVVVDYAETAGKLTPEQAEALRKAGTVPLSVAPPANALAGAATGPSNPLLPPPGAGL